MDLIARAGVFIAVAVVWIAPIALGVHWYRHRAGANPVQAREEEAAQHHDHQQGH